MSPTRRKHPRQLGPWRILRPLGHGGAGVVYRAKHAQTGEPAAVKTVLVTQAASLESIRREIHALARLSHPGIVPIIGEGVDGGLPWYAMRLVEGVPLDRACSRLARKGLAPVLTLMRRLCAPLAYLHGEGLVHRDLKPDNVVVCRAEGDPIGWPVLVDFGIVSRFSGLLAREQIEVAGHVSGTVHYMAPEQCRGELVDARADLYSLGCILYEQVTGRPPFVAEVAAQVLYEHCRVEPASPSSVAENVPAELEELILRLLAKAPARRIGHADDVSVVLARLGAEEPAPSPGPRPRAYLYRPGLVGRDDPLSALVARLEESSDGRGGLAFVGGESGIGKSRLAMALAQGAQLRGFRVLTGDCVPVGAGAPFHPLRRPLQALADRCREVGAEETQRLLGGNASLLAPFAPALADVPGQDLQPAPAELPPSEARLRLFTTLAAALVALAERSAPKAAPVLLILDDLQWADELTLGFVQHAAETRAFEQSRILVLATYRSEEVDAGARGPSLQAMLQRPEPMQLRLGRLGESAVEAMVGEMLALEPPPRLFSRYLCRQSEGNPFFVAEYLRAAIEGGPDGAPLLWRDELGHWQVADPTERRATEADYERLGLPRSLRELVSRRLQGLPPPARGIVEACAVLGREVRTVLLEQVVPPDREALTEDLAELFRRQVLEEAGPGAQRFVHDKIREVAYGSIDGAQRSALHRLAAEALERLLEPAERTQHLAELGRHWDEAGETARARDCYLAAAREAAARYAYAEAERLYRAYLERVSEPTPESITASNELGASVFLLQGRLPEARQQHDAALLEARRLGHPAGEASSLRLLGNVHFRSANLVEAIDCYQKSLTLDRQIGNRRGEAGSLSGLALAFDNRSDSKQARHYCELAIASYRKVGDRTAEARMLDNLASILRKAGQVEVARSLHEQALPIHREVGDRYGEASGLSMLAVLHAEQGRLGDARSALEHALAIHQDLGDPRAQGVVLSNLAQLHAEQGRLEEAATLAEQALALHRTAHDRVFEAVTLGNLGKLHRQHGQLDEARDLFGQALDIHRELGSRRLEATIWTELATVLSDQGQPEDARQLWAQALAAHRELRNRRLEGVTQHRLASLERRSGRLDLAAECLEQARLALAEVSDRGSLALCCCEQGHLALALGRSAAKLLEQARQSAAESGAGSRSQLGQAIGRLGRAEEAFAAGEPLFNGECVDDLPVGLRRWLDGVSELTAT